MVQRWVEQHLVIEVHCSKGTYIRTLAEDIGQALGCGAHISALHRLSVGNYQDMVDFNKIIEEIVQRVKEYPENSISYGCSGLLHLLPY